MDFFAVLKLLAGVAFFLFGMNVMSKALEKMSGGRLEKTLKKATSSKLKSVALGAGITIAIQSSSAMTVMLVGLVNSGIMNLHQTVGVIMGSNVGTTLTAWILALAGIESDVFLLRLLKPESFAPVFAVIGIIMIMASKRTKRRDIGEIFVGFAVLMFGMVIMKEAVTGLEGSAEFRQVLTAFTNPFLGVLVGAVFTGIIQSSAASVGVLQTFAATVGISYGAAIPIIMGQNIGTCVTALIAAIGVNKNAKRVAVAHIYFNVIGTALYMIVIYGLNALIGLEILQRQISPLEIAVFHSIFNISVTAVLLPFSKGLEKLAMLTVRDKPSDTTTYAFLDERLLNTPAFAIAQCRDMTFKMAEIAMDAMKRAMGLLKKHDERSALLIRDEEMELDLYEDKLGTYMVKVSSRELTDNDNWEVSMLLHMIGDFERIGDHAVNVMQSAQEIQDKGIVFSDEAMEDIAVVSAAMTEIIGMTLGAFVDNDLTGAGQVEPLEQVIDELVADMRSRHIQRLQRGECSIIAGFIWSDILINLERVSDHCSNIAINIIQIKSESMDRHSYLQVARSADNPEFMSQFEAYRQKYLLK